MRPDPDAACHSIRKTTAPAVLLLRATAYPAESMHHERQANIRIIVGPCLFRQITSR